MGVPKALREQLWKFVCGKQFEYKCSVKWCKNILDPFNFEAGHIIPESKGGSTNLENLLPICSSCNKSMGNRYTIHEFSEKFASDNTQLFEKFRYCFRPKVSVHHSPSQNGS